MIVCFEYFPLGTPAWPYIHGQTRVLQQSYACTARIPESLQIRATDRQSPFPKRVLSLAVPSISGHGDSF